MAQGEEINYLLLPIATLPAGHIEYLNPQASEGIIRTSFPLLLPPGPPPTTSSNTSFFCLWKTKGKSRRGERVPSIPPSPSPLEFSPPLLPFFCKGKSQRKPAGENSNSNPFIPPISKLGAGGTGGVRGGGESKGGGG